MAVLPHPHDLLLSHRYPFPHTVNICFCVFNTDYWLYAFETYFYNLYYLFLVGYVTKSYLFKYRQIVNFKKFLLDP